MPQRKKRIIKKRAAKKRPASRVRAASQISDRRKDLAVNQKAQWIAYKELQQQVNKAWTRLRAAAKRKADPQTLLQDRDELLLLLGECNYMARECMRLSNKRRL